MESSKWGFDKIWRCKVDIHRTKHWNLANKPAIHANMWHLPIKPGTWKSTITSNRFFSSYKHQFGTSSWRFPKSGTPKSSIWMGLSITIFGVPELTPLRLQPSSARWTLPILLQVPRAWLAFACQDRFLRFLGRNLVEKREPQGKNQVTHSHNISNI